MTTRPLLLGHRGARLYAAENTLQAFDLALAHGCDGFEFDVRRSSDGVAVITHNRKIAGLEVASATYAELCQQALSETVVETLRARLPEEGAVVPCLEDVLARYGERAYLDIELKVEGLEEDVVETLKGKAPKRGFLVSSFLPKVLERLHVRDARLPLGLICGNRKQLEAWPHLPVQSVLPRRNLVSRKLVDAIRSSGRKGLVWTVNRQREMLALAEMQVDGIISDDTALLGRCLGGR